VRGLRTEHYYQTDHGTTDHALHGYLVLSD
jgi:hypothetical protein